MIIVISGTDLVSVRPKPLPEPMLNQPMYQLFCASVGSYTVKKVYYVAVTIFSVAKSFWNSVQSKAAILSYHVHIFRRNHWLSEILCTHGIIQYLSEAVFAWLMDWNIFYCYGLCVWLSCGKLDRDVHWPVNMVSLRSSSIRGCMWKFSRY